MATRVLEEIAADFEKLLEEFGGVEWQLIDDRQLALQGNEGKELILSAKELQSSCPCAICREKKQEANENMIVSVEAVGAYALKFTFSGGCSKGIYPLAYLLELAKEKSCAS